MFGDFDLRVINLDYSRSFRIVPFIDLDPEKYIVYLPTENGWVKKELSQFSEPDEKFLEIPYRWGEKLFFELKKTFDPKDSISVDKFKTQSAHLDDMRRIAFTLLKIKS